MSKIVIFECNNCVNCEPCEITLIDPVAGDSNPEFCPIVKTHTAQWVEKIGIKPNPVVDEQKRAWALDLMYYHDNFYEIPEARVIEIKKYLGSLEG